MVGSPEPLGVGQYGSVLSTDLSLLREELWGRGSVLLSPKLPKTWWHHQLDMGQRINGQKEYGYRFEPLEAKREFLANAVNDWHIKEFSRSYSYG